MPDWLRALIAARLPAWFMSVENPACRYSAGRARFDTLRLIAEAVMADPTGALMSHHGLKTTLNVTVPLDTLLGLREDPGQLAGYGPLPAEIARLLATDATWRRIITDPVTGVTMDTGTTAYTPTTRMRRLLRAMHPTCTFPGCSVPAERCDDDHLTSWPQGRTTVRNMQPLCRKHHGLKTHQPGWHARRDYNTATIRWTSPTGRHTTSEPERHQPVPTPSRTRTGAATATSTSPRRDTGVRGCARVGDETTTATADPASSRCRDWRTSGSMPTGTGMPSSIEGLLIDVLTDELPSPEDRRLPVAERRAGEEFDPLHNDTLERLRKAAEPEPVPPPVPDDPPPF